MRCINFLSIFTGLAFVAAGAAKSELANAQQDAGPEQSQIRALVDAYYSSGQKIFDELAKSPGNIVISPLSIGMAMAMARSGARGETEREMTNVLRHSLDRGDMERANGELLATFAGYKKDALERERQILLNKVGCYKSNSQTSECMAKAQSMKLPAQSPFALDIANALMLAGQGNLVSQDYMDLVRKSYAAEFFKSATAAKVNSWAKDKTRGRVDKILSKELDRNDVAVLLNAVYFKSRWQSEFPKQYTSDQLFRLSSSADASVRMMQKEGRYAVVQKSDLQAVRIPYEDAKISMIVVMPNDVDRLHDSPPSMEMRELSLLFANLEQPIPPYGRLTLPLFSASTPSAADSLKGIFETLGMKLAFDNDEADFSGMTAKLLTPPVYIKDILHRAMVDVDEKGTVAAAVTAIRMNQKSAPPALTFDIRIDRPFLFYIVDYQTGAIFFQGRVMDPRASNKPQ